MSRRLTMRKKWWRGWESDALREVWGGTQGDTFLDVDMEENPERDLGEDGCLTSVGRQCMQLFSAFFYGMGRARVWRGSVEEGACDVPMKK